MESTQIPKIPELAYLIEKERSAKYKKVRKAFKIEKNTLIQELTDQGFEEFEIIEQAEKYIEEEMYAEPEAWIWPDTSKLKSKIMYIEKKAGNLIGPAKIGRVYFSRTGKTLYYDGKRFQSLKGQGFKSNYFDVDSGEDYWISGPKKDGSDRLYNENMEIEIDDDVKDEYWNEIRKQTI